MFSMTNILLYNKKDRRTNQRKRKVYARRTSMKKSRQEFNVNNFAGNESDDTDTEDESMNDISSSDENSE